MENAGSPPDSDYTTFGTLKVDEPEPLPEVLDIFVAGGGPAGVAAAARARELGLTSLVVDYDDLLKRIRDYPKEKPIKPSYGGGDKLAFPPGGPLVTSLQFDEIDKDAFVVDWKGKLKKFNLAAKVGTEITGLLRETPDFWTVKTWNHRSGQEVLYRARTVLLAIGAGVPRRFDIPGNTDGIAFRLDDPKRYVGAPALVVGGGTSAAEAVIAISNAKAKAGDTTRVYWSYRGDKMPKVSKALSEEFFDAYVGNGNIQYLPFSEPVAVFAAPDKQEYLSLRIDRKEIVGRPAESVHLEFPKNQVVACIGEDVPFRLLQSLGIKVALVNDRPLVLVNHNGETSLPGVYLAGDVRGPRYVRCTDFDDTSTYEQVVQKRNIKLAMWEAVQIVEHIAERLGKAAAVPAREVAPASVRPEAAPAVVPPLPSEPAEAHESPYRTQVVILLPDDTVEEEFPITKERVTIGRTDADISCPEDAYMSARHAVLWKQGDDWLLEDAGGGSGVWMRVRGTRGWPLEDGDLVWVGSQIVRAGRKDGWSIEHYDREGALRGTYRVTARGLFLGRASEAKLDPDDRTLSRRHAQLRVRDGVLEVFDLGSRNGTFVKITKPTRLASGDEFRLGSKRFRFETFAEVSRLGPADVVVEAPLERPPAPAEAPPPAAVAEGLVPVVVEHPEHPASFGVVPGKQDLLHGFFDYLKTRYPDLKLTRGGDPAEHMDEPLGWECKVGLCGLCAVEVVEGAENFEPVDPGGPELDTLANKAFLEPDPRRFRLACLARVRGPVKLRIPQG